MCDEGVDEALQEGFRVFDQRPFFVEELVDGGQIHFRLLQGNEVDEDQILSQAEIRRHAAGCAHAGACDGGGLSAPLALAVGATRHVDGVFNGRGAETIVFRRKENVAVLLFHFLAEAGVALGLVLFLFKVFVIEGQIADFDKFRFLACREHGLHFFGDFSVPGFFS